ncbi:hemerythrin domain-containing protein [Pollutibacter soli]|uniref:hemerythrin domain-containing protein n=1 Tax=Pollutibacter soli TaxID=3034157 RepID=UPI0030139319
MKDRLPLKRHQALVEFSRDHHYGLLLVWKIKQGLANAIDPERIANYAVFFFDHDLKKHFSEEESDLFPLLPVDNLLRLQAENDHTRLTYLIENIRQNKSNRILLAAFADALKLHIRFEERELFEAIQTVLPDINYEINSPGAHKCNSDPDADWPDIFWMPENANTKKEK